MRILGEDSSNLKAISEILPDFRRVSGIEVVAELADFSTALSKSTADLSAGTGYYDIVLQYNFSLSSYVRNRYILNIDELKHGNADVFRFEHDILRNVWNELGFYAIPPFDNFNLIEPIAYPFAANTMILAMNRRILEDAAIIDAYKEEFHRPFRPPTTWEELARAANIISRTNPSLKGIALQGAAGGWLYYEWVHFLFGLGGRIMNKQYGWQSDLNTPLTLNSDAAVQAVKLYLSMKPANAGDFYSVDAVKQRDIMLEGKTAFALMWTDYIPDLTSKAADMFTFAPVPGTASMIAGGCYFVNRKTRSAANAAALISYLLSPSIQKRLAKRGLFPPTAPPFNEPEILQIPYMPAVRDSLMRGIYMAEAGPDADLISQEITNALQLAWKGEIRPEQAPTNATKAISEGRKSL
ncbi:extracellular solute-binding protein [Rhodopseudomonas palustris]|nr:extracellular solute-binding protein [Rhodopseudomonas palustris]